MRKQSFAILVGFFTLGCGNVTFSTLDLDAATLDSDAATEDQINESTATANDGGIDSQSDAPVFCEPYGCRSGCGECDAGTQCGNGGGSICGSTNCSLIPDTFVDAATYNCPSNASAVYSCFHYAGKNTKDFMPRCLARGRSTADNESTFWCCPQ